MGELIKTLVKLSLIISDGIFAVVDQLNCRRQETRDEIPVQNIMIWSMDRLGDVVRSTPAIRILKRRYPDAVVTAVIAGRSARVLEGNPWIDKLYTVKNPYRLKDHFDIFQILKEKPWHLAVLLEADEYWSRLGQIFCRILSAKRIVSFDFGRYKPSWCITVPLSGSGSWSDQFVRLVTHIGGECDDRGLELHVLPGDYASARQRLVSLGISPEEPFILIHPGGNFLTVSRQWPRESFARFISLLKDKRDCPVVITGVKEEDAIAKRIQSLTEAKTINACGLFSLRELMAVIDMSVLLVSNDTGPLHIAQALGTPTVAIVGPTAPMVIGISKNCRIVRRNIACSPCAYYQGWKVCSNQKKWECLTTIAPEEVLDAALSQTAGLN